MEQQDKDRIKQAEENEKLREQLQSFLNQYEVPTLTASRQNSHLLPSASPALLPSHVTRVFPPASVLLAAQQALLVVPWC